MRYTAIFISGRMELEKETEDLGDAKAWVANLLKDYPSPDHIRICDELEEKTVFEEKGVGEK